MVETATLGEVVNQPDRTPAPADTAVEIKPVRFLSGPKSQRVPGEKNFAPIVEPAFPSEAIEEGEDRSPKDSSALEPVDYSAIQIALASLPETTVHPSAAKASGQPKASSHGTPSSS